MAQSDLTIQNQSFPSFRSDLNDALTALNTTQSGTSRPTSAVAGTIWLDTTSATTPTLKLFDGTDDISLATLDYTANTVNWLDSSVTITGLSSTATSTVLTLTDTNVQVSGGATQGGELRFYEDTDTGSNYVALKAGNPASNKTFILPNADGTTGQALVTDGSGNLSFGDVASDLTAVDSNIVPDTTDTYDLGTSSFVWRNIYTGDLHLSNESKTEGNSVDGTKGSWTIQEGADDLYLLNNKSGKKYKFKLEEI
jgi:hypothetical protein